MQVLGKYSRLTFSASAAVNATISVPRKEKAAWMKTAQMAERRQGRCQEAVQTRKDKNLAAYQSRNCDGVS